MAEGHVDRNLLFGVLALQMDFVSRESLIAAMHAWVLEKHKLLGDILVDQGALAASRRSLISAVVEEHVALHHGDPHQSLVALRVPVALQRDLEQFSGDPQFQASLVHLAEPVPAERDAETTLVVGRGESAADGRFEILRPHAAGGLGEVHIALDRELNREVALKRIHNRHASRSDSRSRFLLEAEITGGLEHPGVVPVYALGTSADGRPYYAMRFIKGETLKEAVEKFHAAETAPDQQRRIDLRQLLNRFIAVCNAIEYAHSRGVIHRDIKPSNIMLGRYGETLVVDWGLAKALGRRNADAPPQEQTLVPSGSGSSETLAGSAIGTPAYMSPEQAAGQIDEIGPASDVYSLGATLYMLLTGKEPFAAPNLGAVLEKVQKGEFAPPRELNRSVPAALDAICRKAMSRLPADRYPSCAALASDVEHWLADERVSAFAEPASVRASRWIRRHRGLTSGGAVLMAALFVGLIVGTVVLGRANSRIADHAKEADRQRDAAELQRADATRQREIAEIERGESARQRDEAQRHLYISQMNLAQKAWDENNIGRARELLDSQTPAHTENVDLRGWEWNYLWRLTHSEIRTLKFLALCVDFSPNGQYLAAGNDDGTLNIWNGDGTRLIRTLKAHQGRINRLIFNFDGSVLGTGSADGTVKLWESATARELRSFPGPRQSHCKFALSQDGRRLAIGSGEIGIWSTEDGKLVQALSGHQNFVPAMAFTADGNRLVSVGWDKTVRVWDLQSAREIWNFSGHRDRVNSVAIRPDGQFAVSGTSTGTIKSWNLEDGTESVEFKGHTLGVTRLVFSSDGKRLFSCSTDTTVKIWDVASGHEIEEFRGHESAANDVALSPDGNIIASGGWDGTIRLWDAASRQKPWSRTHPCEVLSVDYSSDGNRLAAGGYGTVSVFDSSTGKTIWTETEFLTMSSGLGTAPAPRSLCFDPQGQILGLALHDGSVRLRDAKTGRSLRTIKAHDGPVVCVDFSPDGRVLATGGYDRSVSLWSSDDGKQLASLRGHSDAVTTVVFSPDGRQLLSAGTEADKQIRLWDVATRRELQKLIGHEGGILCAVFSRDGSQIFSGSRDEMIRTWDVKSGQTIRVHRGHAGDVKCLSLSPDGKRLVSCSNDQTVRLWDIGTGQELQTFNIKTGQFLSVDFSPDGTRLAAAQSAGSSLGRITVWDARPLTSELRATLVVSQFQAAVDDLVQSLFATRWLKRDVIEAINADATISNDLRKSALIAAEQWQVNPNELNDRSWSLAAQPGRTIDQYQLAFRCAEAACELIPDNGPFLNTLGVARYRVGQFAEATEILIRSNELNSKLYGGSGPSDIAFLAMAHHQLGHADQAGKFLEQLRQLLETDRWKTDAESKAFLQEAATLIPAPATPVEAPPKTPS